MRNFHSRGEANTRGVCRAVTMPGFRPNYWWTQPRKDKLRYVMETYDDIEKAARVLGVSVGGAAKMWAWIRWEEAK